jgi:S-(hydroxymethyl)glutathione dehydrogenase/alcohol dehydrogenase
MKTRAAILVEQKKPLVLADIDVPDPTFGQVLVKLAYTGVCGSQIGEIDGVKGPDRWLPHLLGHEATGVVEAVGPHVRTVAEGDRVVLHWRQGAGINAPTPKYAWGEKTVNAGWVTTFQERTIVSENRVTKLPEGADMETGVLYGCALTTGFGAVVHDANLKPGESVLVFGAGGVGACAVLAAHLAGAHPIVAVDLYDHKLELAKRFGATHVINSTTGDVAGEVSELLGGGVDVVIENTGVETVMAQAYALAGPKGRTILVGVPRHDVRLPIDTMPLHFGKVLTGSYGGGTAPEYEIPRLVRLEQAGRFDPRPLISHRYSLEQINEAIDAMRRGEVVRSMISLEG